MKWSDDYDRLPLSSLKQFVYCQRRYALMYIENEWGSNYKIVEGDLLHDKVDNPFFNEKRVDTHISRSVPVYSNRLGLYGVADIVEFYKDQNGIEIEGKKGLWKLCPLEYKNGKPEKSSADNYQICAQAICLEEMFNTKIENGNIYYGKLKRRVLVEITKSMKDSVVIKVDEMKTLLMNNTIPEVPDDQNCSLCSLVDICMPYIIDKRKIFRDRITDLLKG